MTANEVIAIIEAIPQYIKFFYPGYITIYIYTFLRAEHVSDTTPTILKSLTLSYVYCVIVDALNMSTEIKFNAMLILISVVAALLMYSIVKSKKVKSFFSFFKINTAFYNNEIEGIRNEEGTWLVIYLKDEDIIYEGWLHLNELEEGKKQYISLTNYRKFKSDENGKSTYIEDHDSEDKEEVVIYYEDIKRIEKRDT